MTDNLTSADDMGVEIRGGGARCRTNLPYRIVQVHTDYIPIVT